MKHCVLFLLLVFSLVGAAQPIAVTKLFCQSAEAPLGIEAATPTLGWQLTSTKRATTQSAYRVLVADNPSLLQKGIGNIWDSKKVSSNNSIAVKYADEKLLSTKTYWWKVMVWNQNGEASAWSKVSTWQMGLPSATDWAEAKWIGYDAMPDSLITVPAEHGKGKLSWTGKRNVLPLLRHRFSTTKQIKRATAFVCGLGQFELFINGKKIGDHFLDPGWTKYDKEAQYVAFDVTKNLVGGSNAVGAMLGNGFYFIPGERYRKLTGAYGNPKLLLRLVIEFADGTVQNIVSDQQWKTAPGPIIFSSIYGGEDYNATLEQKDWSTASFNDVSWKAVVVTDGPPVLYHQSSAPLKVHEHFSPKSTKKLDDGSYVFDMGQNASGMPFIQMQGRRGDTVRITPAELLKEDGSANQRSTGSPVWYQYILKGDGVESWQPRFSYYGFRYLQVQGAVIKGDVNPKGVPVISTIRSLHTRNAAETVGHFECSSPLFNRTFSLINWAIKSNMTSILTDCPHREKLGWLEQTHLMGSSIQYNYHMAAFFLKTLRDMRTAQSDSGLVPEYVPEFVKMPFMDGIFMDSPEWGSAAIILPWYHYQWYGDKTVLEENYSLMQGYEQHLQSKSKDGIVAYGLSDWYDLGPAKPGLAQLTPMGLTATAIWHYDLTILQQAATLMGKTADAALYEAKARAVSAAFNRKFFNAETAQYGSGSQTANAMALYMNLVPEQHKAVVLENLITDIRSRGNAITAGDVGFRYLLQVLQREGRSDVIWDMNSRSDVPGYGMQLAKGATALTESWQALPTVSNNHLMLGHLMEWFYSGLGGIRQAEGSIGYKSIVIDPQAVGDVTSTNVSYNSLYGAVKSNWKRTKSSFQLAVQVPVNTTAIVYLPAIDKGQISEGGKAIAQQRGIEALGQEGNKMMYKIGSGSYHFVVDGAVKSSALSK